MKKLILAILAITSVLACGGGEMKSWQLVKLPQGYSDSHILSIRCKDNQILLGTYGRGALLSRNDGRSWNVFDTSKGLSWDFILGGDWDGKYIILATLGDGVNISTNGGANWIRYGYNYFGVEYLYAVDAIIRNHTKYVPTADGLVIFDDIKKWRSATEKDGLPSQYLYDIAFKGDTIALGTLHGYALSFDRGSTWTYFSPNGKMTADHQPVPACKVRAVEFAGSTLYAGCDDGLYMSPDQGGMWTRLGQDTLSSEFIHDLLLDKKGTLWIATYKEVASYQPQKQMWRIFNAGDGLPDGSINCLGIDGSGRVLAGTNYGLYKLTSKSLQRVNELPVDAEFTQTEEPLHQWMLRPISPTDQNCKDQTYLYGSTMGGNFRQHQGNEYNNPEGVPTLAVDDGSIVFEDTSIGHAVLRCDRQQDGVDIFAHYHHQDKIVKSVGDHLRRGEQIGMVGKKGNVTNEHLHFEVAYTELGSQIESTTTRTRNSELWVAPLQGCGTIVGNLVDSLGMPVGGARIYGLTKPIPTETPFSFAETYMEKVHPDDVYKENFVIGDVPAGDYVLFASVSDTKSRIKVHVDPGKVTRVKMELRK
jgi:murein DD-endopeptidase MepM/ murein hydrolase activator NlpD